MSEKPLITIRLAGVPEPFNLPWLLALERRAFVRAGLEVKWLTVPQGTGAMCSMLDDGTIDMAVLVTEGAVRSIMQGSKNRIVAPMVDSSLTWGVHVGAGTEMNSPKDLVGIPYVISRFNSGSHLMAMVHAKKLGWTPSEKDFIVVNDLKGAVERLRTAEPAVFLWEKAITAGLVNDGTLRRVDELRPEWPAFVVVGRTEFLQGNPDAVLRLMRVFRDQAKGLKERKGAADMIAQRFGMALSDAQAWSKDVIWNIDGKVDLKVLRAVAVELTEAGTIDGVGVKEAALGKAIWTRAFLKG